MRAIKLNNDKIKSSEPFKSLFTQGMVCHETYKKADGKWLSPDMIEKKSEGNYVLKGTNTKVNVGPSEAMSKSKKNIIDPESMIKIYGADAVRWFILSDSPPEKDVQWSSQGVNASYKFLQKIYNLNFNIFNREDKKKSLTLEKDFNNNINVYFIKMTKLIENFHLNVAIANVYEIYHLFNEGVKTDLSKECLRSNLVKFMQILMPFTPHLASECLEMIDPKKIDLWPVIDEINVTKQKIKIAIQFNGKTREIIEIEKDLIEEVVLDISKKNIKVMKYLKDKEVKRTIYVKNKIINYLIK